MLQSKHIFTSMACALVFGLSCSVTQARNAASTNTHLPLETAIYQDLNQGGIDVSQISTHHGNQKIQLCGFLKAKEAKKAEKIVKKKYQKKGELINDIISKDALSTKLKTNEKTNFENIQFSVQVKLKAITKNITEQATLSAQTYRGVVELCGFAKSQQVKIDLANSIAGVTGVSKIYNNIIIDDNTLNNR